MGFRVTFPEIPIVQKSMGLFVPSMVSSAECKNLEIIYIHTLNSTTKVGRISRNNNASFATFLYD